MLHIPLGVSLTSLPLEGAESISGEAERRPQLEKAEALKSFNSSDKNPKH